MKSISFLTFARRLCNRYDDYRFDAFSVRRFTPEVFSETIETLVTTSGGLLKNSHAGTSFEGKPIRLISVGAGKIPVLLWTQMHGDESTATMATADILNYLIKTNRDEPTRRMLSKLTLHFLPMLNPDGAARFQRRTAQGIDMNRDALALQTPEARCLKKLQHKLLPYLGFNLHDQELSTMGSSKELTALALLTPACDIKKSDNEVRKRAKHLAASFVETMRQIGQHRLAKYDDAFEPRAFGDNMMKWGTSTLLIESGHTLNDPEKQTIRKLNVVGILACFYAVATGEYKKSSIEQYENLPLNGKKAYDLIIRNILVGHRNGKTTLADLGISYQVDTHSESTPVLVDAGDLHPFIGVKELDGRLAKVSQDILKLGKPFAWKQLGSFSPAS